MTEQRYDILVQDKVSRSIRTELLAIAGAAKSARTSIADFKTQMASMAGSMSTLRGGAQTLRTQAQAAQAATAAIQAQTAAIQQQVQAMNALQTASAAAARAGGGRAGTGGGGSGGGGGGTGARPASPISGIAQASRNARGINDIGEAARLSSNHLANLSFQLNDVFVSLASGQKPMMVFIQQGAQIAQIPQMAGMGFKTFGVAALNTLGIIKRTGDTALDTAAAVAKQGAASLASANQAALGNVRIIQTEIALAEAQVRQAATATQSAAAATRLAAAQQALEVANLEATVSSNALAAAQARSAAAASAAQGAQRIALSGAARAAVYLGGVLLAATAATAALDRQASKDSGLRKFTKEMGYSATEVKKLNDVTVTFGDTAKAVFQVGWQRLAAAFGIETDSIGRAWNSTLDWMAQKTLQTVSGIYALMTGLPTAVARTISAIQSGEQINLFEIIGGSFKDQYDNAMKFMDDVVVQARKNAKARQDAMAEEFRNNRTGGFDRAKEWKDQNDALDEQIKMLRLYGSELERATKLEQIAQVFRKQGVPLSQQEVAILERKIKLIQDGARIQSAMTTAEEEANGATRRFADQQEALNRLLQQGDINAAQFAARMNVYRDAVESATNPLFEMNRALEDNAKLIGSYGKDRDLREYMLQLEQAARAKGESIYQDSSGVQANGDIVVSGRAGLSPQTQQMRDEFLRQQRQQEMTDAFEAIDLQDSPGSSSYILDNYKEMYAEIQRMREEDVRNEEEANKRKENLDRALMDARLEYTSDSLGRIAQMQDSKSKEAAAIGKAAAIAQATIDGIGAVQAALKGPPGPPWSFAIAASVAAMTAANVGKITGIGFQRGGFTGPGSNASVKGMVHANEYVFDAQATSRIGVPALEAARAAGSLSQPGSGSGAGVSVNVIPMPGVFVEERRTPSGEIELIARRIVQQEAAEVVANSIYASPNSKMSKAVSQNYGVARVR